MAKARSTRNSPASRLLPSDRAAAVRRGGPRQGAGAGHPDCRTPTTLQHDGRALYVNHFNKAGRVYRVVAGRGRRYRMTPEDIGGPKKPQRGDGAAVGAVSRVKTSIGPTS